MPANNGPRSALQTGRAHRSQAERRERTRTALLDATIDSLVERGYARTSVQEICARAGVSTGAAQHHFPTKAELMATAVEHLTHRIGEELLEASRAQQGPLPSGPGLIERGIELLWHGFSGRLSAAVLELWVAARTDAELAAAMRPVDRALGRSTWELFASLAGGPAPQSTETLFWLSVNLIRGLALDAQIGGDPTRRAHLVAEWTRIARAVYEDERPG